MKLNIYYKFRIIVASPLKYMWLIINAHY